MSGKIEIPSHFLNGLSFSMFSSEEIIKLSVKELTNPRSFDQLGHPTIGGLYDPALGPSEPWDHCQTCGLTQQTCPGHTGHIKLPFVVYNPVFFTILHRIIRGTCFECHRLAAHRKILHLLKCQLKALDYGLLGLVEELRDVVNNLTEISGGERFLDEKTVIQQLKETLEAAIGEDREEGGKHRSQVKNVVEMRHKLVKEFISGRVYQKTKCPNCLVPLRPVKTEHNNKMFFTSLSKKSVAKIRAEVNKDITLTKSAKGVKRRAETIDEYEETGELVEIDELEERLKERREINVQKYEEHQILSPAEARRHLAMVWENEGELLGQILGALQVNTSGRKNQTDIFFIDCVAVLPSKYRPVISMGDMRLEGPQTKNFVKVLECCNELKDLLRLIKEDKDGQIPPETIPPLNDALKDGKTEHMSKVHHAWIRLQNAVNIVYDSELDKLNSDRSNGIKQILEKKEGLFRKHMMGKRVNFAARTVISPDPYINTNEIGIPEVFAKKLYYPQPVTHWNFTELRQAVINGPEVHPGASFVVMENGSKVMLKPGEKFARTKREAVAKQLLTPSTEADHTFGVKMVCRHLQNGDVLLLNRQPTLHRPSIQAHKARVLKGEKTFRLHYANCKAYNADFDGDEMNAHFPQDEISRAEAYNIASTDFNYLVPKDGSPLAGLIQDHMVAGVRLTIRGRFFNREDYQQLVFSALTNKAGDVIQLPPCILKPRPLWSGKQVLSTVLLNIIPDGKARLNLDGKSKIASKSFQSRKRKSIFLDLNETWTKDMDESHVVLQGGELLVGVLDKGHYGATAYGLVHCCYELYGGPVAGMILTSFAKLFTFYLQLYGFSLGVEDILCTEEGDKKRRQIMEEGSLSGNKTAAKALNLDLHVDEPTLKKKLQEAHFLPDGSGLKDLDLSMKGSTDEIQNKISNVLMPLGLLKSFPSNNLQLMVQSGAKGSTVNCMQISCLLGQIELEGRRPPLMMSGQSLPSFQAYETSPRAGGFVDGRFLTGIRPQEYFFHCMAGREGLVDTAVKTSRSGYLQRCIIKHLEGLTVAYDQTVRDSDGSVIQFDYGTDGLEVTKTQFLKKKQFPFLIQNQKVMPSDVSEKLNTTQAPVLWKQLKKREMKWQEKYGDKIAKCSQVRDKWYDKNGHRVPLSKPQGFSIFCDKKWKNVVAEYDNEKLQEDCGRTKAQEKICDMWEEQSEKKKAKYRKGAMELGDPVVAQIHPAKNLGAVTERFQAMVDDFIQENMGQMVREDGDEILKESSKYISESKLRSILYVNYMRSLVPPGEAVGLIAAQSIGEPSTQMTLNTFHFAGRGEMNVTLGIPRLREILMVASANIRTPTMDIPLLRSKKAKTRGKELKSKLNKVHLSQVLEDVEVVESFSFQNAVEEGRLYKIKFQFLPPETYQEEYCVTPNMILKFMENKFFLQMVKAIDIKMKLLSKTTLLSSASLRNRAKDNEEDEEPAVPEPVDDDDMSGDEQHDDDALARKARAKKDEENEYEGEDEEKEEVDEEESDEEAGDDNYYGDDMEENGEGAGDTPSNSRPSSPTGEPSQKKSKKGKAPEMCEKRITAVLACIHGSAAYRYDTSEELWCEITLKLGLHDKKLDMAACIEGIARSSVVYQVPHINRCFLSESKKPGEEGTWRIKTEGVNIHEMYRHHKILNLNQLYSNDIHAMAHNYGIEAACSVLIQEINDVFGNYGIQVDYRHLSLIADYMTFEGEYKAFNRMGIESNASPLQKMTFETTMHFLKTATITGARDDLKSPSSRLVTGQLVKGGTGAFELMQKLNL